jgi:hypothetical protein
MKRSADVTASAIVLFVGSGLFLLFLGFTVLIVFTTGGAKGLTPANAIPGLVMYAGMAAWGIVTAVGILGLREWARYSILVMSGFAAAIIVFAGVFLAILFPVIMKTMPNAGSMPPGFLKIMLVVELFFLLPPLGISIWWLVAFTRPRVRAQFAAPGASALAAARDAAPAALAPSGAPPLSTPAPLATARPPIPTSIRVIAIIYLAMTPFSLLFLPHAVSIHMPTVILGVLVTGSFAWMSIAAISGGLLAFSLLSLLRKPWALDGLIALQSFYALNGMAFLISPSRNRYLNAVLQRTTTPGVDPELMRRMFSTIKPFIFALSALLALVALYFLLTRRTAYRAACAR